MKLAGQFALGGFGVATAITFAIFGCLAVQNGLAVRNGFGSNPGDLSLMVADSLLFGLFGAGGGAVLALLVQRFSAQPPNSVVPADDDTVWPPPPVIPLSFIPLSAEQFSEDSAPE